MNLTPEQQELGRRNFLRALAGTPALAALGASVAVKGPIRGGPVRLGYVGLGGQGRVLLDRTDPKHGRVVALCDVNPDQLAKADQVLEKRGLPPAPHYAEWKEMLEKEDLEAVVLAPPLWLHADIALGCLEAGRHVLCEKMMAWDLEGCRRMRDAARRSGRLLEIGYQRFYNPIYQAAYEGIVRTGELGEIYTARLAWHRNGNWRRAGEPPSPDYDPSAWGYPSFEHLLNWRLYWRYSKGLLAELGSHQIAIANWVFGGPPETVLGSGGVYRFKDGREVDDHVYATFEYSGGRTAVFSTIESNAFDHYYEAIFGTKGTLILRRESEAFLFDEGGGARTTAVEVTPAGSGPMADASESRAADALGQPVTGGQRSQLAVSAYEREVSGFCAAVRTGQPLRCGPDRALRSAASCLAAHEAVQSKRRVAVEV